MHAQNYNVYLKAVAEYYLRGPQEYAQERHRNYHPYRRFNVFSIEEVVPSIKSGISLWLVWPVNREAISETGAWNIRTTFLIIVKDPLKPYFALSYRIQLCYIQTHVCSNPDAFVNSSARNNFVKIGVDFIIGLLFRGVVACLVRGTRITLTIIPTRTIRLIHNRQWITKPTIRVLPSIPTGIQIHIIIEFGRTIPALIVGIPNLPNKLLQIFINYEQLGVPVEAEVASVCAVLPVGLAEVNLVDCWIGSLPYVWHCEF